MKRATATSLCALVLVAAAATAHARPRHHHHHRRAVTSAHINASAADINRYPFLADPEAGANGAAKTREPHSRQAARRAARVAAQSHANSAYGDYSSNDLVAEARKYIGTNPTGRGSLWCGAFMDLVLKQTGHKGGGNLALGYEHYGTRVSGPQVGAIAVMGRHGGGHVGVVTGIDGNGNPIIVSGNHNHTVAESVYPRGRIAAYVVPGG
ncbi:MAG TPA: TIGR02594 family protein [Pseudolabrys sp.]|jgi:uncharacterized protein (TIGR02594 family)|nr:TIGR02594 family protein [Pseudolabrys sp.]